MPREFIVIQIQHVSPALIAYALQVDDVIWDDSAGCGVANAYNALRLLQAPFSLFRDELLSGIQADVDLVLDNGQSYFDGIEGLAPGVYFFDIYRVRHNISYSEEYARTPYVWGRGVATTGYAFSAYPSTDVFYGLPMTEISNITETGFDVTSYVYRLYNISGVPVAFIPADTAHVTYAYSVLGIKDVSPPSVEVLTPNGGEYFKSGQKIGITWNVQDEYIEGIICGVSINYSGGIGDWTVLAHNLPVDSNGSGEFEFTIPCAIPHVEDDCRIRVIALDTNAKQGLDQSDLDFTIEYLLKPDDDPIPGQGSTPEFKDLVLDPIPNPFNPSTTLRFQVGKTGQVTIEIYDVAGKRIRTICKMRRFQPGSHDLLWDGKNKDGIDVANGIYFACFQINNMTDTKKLVLVR